MEHRGSYLCELTFTYREYGVGSMENLDATVAVYAFGAFVGLVGLLSRVGKGIKVEDDSYEEYVLTRVQGLLSPATFGIELMMAFPFLVNLFGVGTNLFQKLVLKDGKLLLELNCHRIVIGFLAVLIINTGCLAAKQYKIAVAFILTHLAIGGSMIYFAYTVRPIVGGPQVTGQLDTPGFLHFAVSLSTTLSFVRAVSNRQIHRERAKAAGRPKQE